MGQVTGSVSDAWTGDPLTAMVELEGVFSMQATPDYSIWAVEGSYSLTAYAEGYYTVTLPVEIIAGEVTEQDIALEPALPKLGELPAEITMSLVEGTIGTQELELVNEGPMPLDFAFFGSRAQAINGSTPGGHAHPVRPPTARVTCTLFLFT
jgi:hypothetical protein